MLQFFPHAEGYVKRNTNNTYLYVYQYKDHLGNVRLSYADVNGNGTIQPASEILEENNYYPFGLKHKGYNEVVNSNRSEAAEKYKFGGKELNDELGLDLYDFGARNYDAAIGRWLNVDPLAEDFAGWTPYHYVHNNPINLIDPTGMAADGWIEQNKDGKTTVTFDPNVNTPEEAKAAGYDNVSQVLPSGTLHGQYNLNSDGSVCGDDANWSRSQRYAGMSYFWADEDTEVRTYNSSAWNSESAQFDSWRRGASGAITPIGGAFDLGGAGYVFGEIVSGLSEELTGDPNVAMVVALVAGRGKVSTSLNVHGNSLKSMRPTWGYKLYSNDGTFLKNGITSKAIPEKRYTKGFMKDKYMDAVKFPNRRAAYDWEAAQNIIKKGPLNKNNH